ncbi:MAG: iron-containing alcohol dehydrogenase [Clostridia bacterium]|nr:iron-containing alcohol dehydrogenase [Clostridia bacterium]
MDMNFFAPVNIITGKDCVKNNADIFREAGKKCMIVTGKNGAKKSGALDDVIAVLKSIGTEYVIFDEIEQNPSYASCKMAAGTAKNADAEFIIGIGGGSPLDAAKAIAVLAVCSDTSAKALYSMDWDKKPLPVIAVGTTAGTGSEVSPVSVITTPEGMKKSFRAPSLYPVVAFGDATYTMSLSPEFTRSTALDTLCHCVESYFNRTSNDISRTVALRGIAILLEMLERTSECDVKPLTFDERETLYCASLYGGLAIGVTGTAFPHTLGYFLSEQYDICHGNACAVYLEEFLNYNCTVAPEDAEAFFKALNTDKETIVDLIRKNLPDMDIKLTEEKISELSPRYENNKSLIKCYGTVDRIFAEALLRKLFIK